MKWKSWYLIIIWILILILTSLYKLPIWVTPESARSLKKKQVFLWNNTWIKYDYRNHASFWKQRQCLLLKYLINAVIAILYTFPPHLKSSTDVLPALFAMQKGLSCNNSFCILLIPLQRPKTWFVPTMQTPSNTESVRGVLVPCGIICTNLC